MESPTGARPAADLRDGRDAPDVRGSQAGHVFGVVVADARWCSFLLPMSVWRMSSAMRSAGPFPWHLRSGTSGSMPICDVIRWSSVYV